jgi:hypothetical protein
MRALHTPRTQHAPPATCLSRRARRITPIVRPATCHHPWAHSPSPSRHRPAADAPRRRAAGAIELIYCPKGANVSVRLAAAAAAAAAARPAPPPAVISERLQHPPFQTPGPAARRERQCKPCSISSMSGGGGAAPVQGTVMRWSQNEWKENWLVVGAPSQQMAGTSRRCHSEFIQSGGSRDLESPD